MGIAARKMTVQAWMRLAIGLQRLISEEVTGDDEEAPDDE